MDVRQLYYDHVQWKRVLAVEADHEHPDFPERASFWSITFYVEGYRLLLTANADTDEIVLAVEPSAEPKTQPRLHPVLEGLIGREFGWIWYTTNVQGYDDMIVLAFDGPDGGAISPQFAFLVEASSIQILRLSSC